MPVNWDNEEFAEGVWKLNVEPYDISTGEKITISWTFGSTIVAEYTALSNSISDMVLGLVAAVDAAISAAGTDGQWEIIFQPIDYDSSSLFLIYGDFAGSLQVQTIGGGVSVFLTAGTGGGFGTGHPPDVIHGHLLPAGSGSGSGVGHPPTFSEPDSVLLTAGTGSGSGSGYPPTISAIAEELMMGLKIWRGDAPAVAQVTHVEPTDIEIGDRFALTINGKRIVYTATAATAANVCDGLAAAIAESTIPEWQEVTAASEGGLLILTANTPGVPFQVGAIVDDGGTAGVRVEVVTFGNAGADSIQRFAIPVTAAGTFAITFGDQTTSGIAVAASAATVETALEGLSTIGSGQVAVSKSTDSNDDIYTVEFTGTLALTDVAPLIVRLTSTKPLVRTIQQGATSGNPRNEIQTVDATGGGAGSFTLTLDAQESSALSEATTAAQVQTALQALSNIETVSVTKSGSVWTIEFTGIDGFANQSQLVASVYSASGTATNAVPVETVQQSATAYDAEQLVTLFALPSAGTFLLSFDGETTDPIAWNAAASVVEAELEALSNIGSGNVAVSGDAGGPWLIAFTGPLGTQPVATLVGDGTGLTNSATEGLTIDTFVPSSGPNHWDEPSNWLPYGVPADNDKVRFEFGSIDCLYGLDQSTVTLLSMEFRNSWTGSLGLPRLNGNGYHEYRTRDLTLRCPTILIGHGEGSGSGKIALNTLDGVTILELRSSGGSRESGVPAVTWYGDHEDTVLRVMGGDLGVAVWSDQSAEIGRLEQTAGTVRLDRTVVGSIHAPGQQLTAHESTLGGLPFAI